MLPSIVSLDPRNDAKNDNEWGEDDGNQVFATRSSCHWRKNVFWKRYRRLDRDRENRYEKSLIY